MMAKTFGWDALFYAGVGFAPRDKSLEPRVSYAKKGGLTQTASVIATPLGEMTRVEESNGVTTRCVKDYLETAEDYEKMIWHTEKCMDFDRESSLDQGRKLREAVGDLGMLGTWVSPSVHMTDVQKLFYHCMDYPVEFGRLCAARRESQKKRLEVYREAGFDFMFYCVSGTEQISPGFFAEWMREEALSNINWWRSLGGFTVWHSCGLIKAFLERGIYNEFLPEVFETISEPPVGDVPSLAWACDRLDPRIAGKGNIPLDVALSGTPDDVREAVRKIKNQTAGRRHIIGFSDAILPGTPAENLYAFVSESGTGRQ